MAYEIHIARTNTEDSGSESSFTLGEWKSFVDTTEGLRFASEGVAAINPATGKEVLALSQGYGNADMLIDNQWLHVFQWRDGGISLNGRPSFEDRKDPVRRMVTQIAAALNATVVGDDGETYD